VDELRWIDTADPTSEDLVQVRANGLERTGQ
jgi:hypothetical protein